MEKFFKILTLFWFLLLCCFCFKTYTVIHDLLSPDQSIIFRENKISYDSDVDVRVRLSANSWRNFDSLPESEEVKLIAQHITLKEDALDALPYTYKIEKKEFYLQIFFTVAGTTLTVYVH